MDAFLKVRDLTGFTHDIYLSKSPRSYEATKETAAKSTFSMGFPFEVSTTTAKADFLVL